MKIKLKTGEIKTRRSQSVALAQKHIPKNTAPNVSDVPRSGCLKTKIAGGIIIAAALKVSKKLLIGLERNHAAKVKMTTSLASSDGCKVIGPMANQRCAPSAEWPLSITAKSKPMFMPHKIGTTTRLVQTKYGTRQKTKQASMPAQR